MTPESTQPIPRQDEFTVNSSDIQKTLAYILRGKAESIKHLRKQVHAKFEEVMDAVDAQEEMVVMVADYIMQEKLKRAQIRSFRSFLREKFIEPDETQEQHPRHKGFGTENMQILWSEIDYGYRHDWFAKWKIEKFTNVAAQYLDGFLEFYDEEVSDEDKNTEGWVKVKDKDPRKKDTPEEWTDEDERWDGFVLQEGDVATVKMLFSCIRSYLKSLKRRIEERGIAEVAKQEKKATRWKNLSQLIPRLKQIATMSGIQASLDHMSEYELKDIMATTLVSWDAYAIEFSSSGEEEK